MPADMKDAPEIVIPAEFASKGTFNVCPPEAIEIYVSRLRKKLEGSGVAVTTVRGLGYLLTPPDVR